MSDDLMLGASALAGLGSAVGNFLGLKSANEANMEMFNKSLEFQKYQYEDSKKYNSAIEQVRRLRAAGINPAFALGSMGAGQVSAGSAPTGNPQQPVSVGELGGLFSGLMNDAVQRQLISSQVNKTNAETEGLGIDNVFRNEDWISKLYSRDMDSFDKYQLGELHRLDVDFANTTMRIRKREALLKMLHQDALLEAQNITNLYLPTQLSQACSEQVAQIALAYAQADSSKVNARANLMAAHNQMMEVFAKYGGTAEEREDYSRQSFNLLIDTRNKVRSEGYKNWLTPVGDLKLGLNGLGFSLPSPVGVKSAAKVGHGYYDSDPGYRSSSKSKKFIKYY